MAGAFSGHLLDAYQNQARFSAAPFGGSTDRIVTSGAMSFNPNMHGTPNMGSMSMADSPFTSQASSFGPDLSEATTLKIAALQAKLNQKLGPEYISQRPGPGGGPKLTYAEGWKIINLANEVFGFNGWSSNVISLTTDFIDFNEESRRYTVGTTAIVRVTLRDGVYHEDIGYGMLENSKSKGGALDKCKKEAVTDGLKRALRNFGNLLGNCLYDKSYTQEVVKIKVPPPKFEKGELHRRPEFEESKPNIASTSASTSKPTPAASSSTGPNTPHTNPPGPQAQSHNKGPSSIPNHMRSEARPAAPAHHSNAATPSVKGKAPQTGLNTPITTPAHFAPPPAHHPNPRKPAPINFNADGTPVHQSRAPAPPAAPAPASRPVPPAAPAPQAPALAHANVSIKAPDDPDESFNFYSDDDAFLALVDLGDLGPPVLAETDLGRPIGAAGDDDGDLGRPLEWDGGTEDGVGDGGGGGGSGGGGAGKGHVQAPQHQRQAGPGMLSRLLPPQNQPQAGRVPQQGGGSGGQNHNRNQSAQHAGGNAASASTSTSASSSAAAATVKRPPSAPMGGFHFPPGMNPQHARAPAQPQPQPQPASAIGLKRPSDAMSGAHRRPGMGLDAGKREVLGRLDLGGGGGDVKRARR